MTSTPKPVVLVVLDGWGYSESPEANAILMADTPVWDQLWKENPHTLIATSGAAVGLPDEQMGNSEVGHMNIGAGRVVYQDFTRITRAVDEGTFFTNPVLVQAVDAAVQGGGAVHIMGLLSPGGVHSHESHLGAAVELAAARGARAIYVHALLDGRDTPPRSARASLEMMQRKLEETGVGRIASIVGRYYAMDRDQRWDRVQSAYELIANAQASLSAPSAVAALDQAYTRGENDEFVTATVITNGATAGVPIEDGDALLFMNFRSDRAREISHAFVDAHFDAFARDRRPSTHFVCLAEYDVSLDAPVAFEPLQLHNGFGEILSNRGLQQLRIAETEKYAHVTFFFNGGREDPFAGEARVLVPSPRIATYDLKPEMSAFEVTEKLVAAIRGDEFDAIVCNYANADMVGHTGKLDAAIRAITALDACLGRLVEAVREVGGELLITADHGNAEQMLDPVSGQAHTAHTTNPVPLVYVGRPAALKGDGALSDMAPTMLYLMGLDQPAEMSGRVLVDIV